MQFYPPDTYWRVSAKALIYDDHNRLLVCMDKNHEWEIPGGGWEHEETFEQCIRRELAEELQVGVTNISNMLFCYKSKSVKGHPKLCVTAKVTLDEAPIRPGDDGLIGAKFVTKDEFLHLPFQRSEDTVKECADQIWPSQISSVD